MSYQVLARKYRPQIFEEVVGQSHVTLALKNSLETDKLGHAYLFYGPRGVGKTTCARLLAKVLNCKNPNGSEPCNECVSCKEITEGRSMDVLEIDAASNRGIENIRDLRQNVKFMPVSGKYKVYIIDEVHMLTMESFNALLKTLEEPPDHVKFIFATTEYQKIPATILSRTQEFHFRRVSPDVLRENMEKVLKAENIPFEEDALFWLVEKADGSVRDSLSILDQAIAYGAGNIKADDVKKLLGLSFRESMEIVLDALIAGENYPISNSLKDILLSGFSLKDFVWEFVSFIRSHVLLLQGIKDPHLLGIPGSYFDTYTARLKKLPAEKWLVLLRTSYTLYRDLGNLHSSFGLEQKIFIELKFFELSEELQRPSLAAMLSSLKELSGKIKKIDNPQIRENLMFNPASNTEEIPAKKKTNDLDAELVSSTGSSNQNRQESRNERNFPSPDAPEKQEDISFARELKEIFDGSEVMEEEMDYPI